MDLFTTYQNKKIHYISEGDGTFALVLIHGFMESVKIWRKFSAELSKQFRVICVDLPGHGQTDHFADVHDMKMQSQCVKKVIDDAKIDKCVIIGHSMGGYVSLQFAEDFPEQTIGFGLFHSNAIADSQHTKDFRNRTIELLNQDKKGFITQFIPDLFAEGNAAKFPDEIAELTADAREMKTESIIASQMGMRDREQKLDLLTSASCPVLFIQGKRDTKSNIEKVFAQALLPMHSEILTVDTGHMGFYEAEKETMSFVKCFVKHCYEQKK